MRGRVLPFPFHFLNNNGAMNIKPRNYSWPEFYRLMGDLTSHSFSPRAIVRRIGGTSAFVPRWLNVVRAISTEGYGRTRYHRQIHQLLVADRAFRDFFEQRTEVVPRFYIDRIRRDLGPIWNWLPSSALQHDQNAFLKSHAVGDGAPTTAQEAPQRSEEAYVA